ncbi:RNA-dependent RNA polymerase [Hubei rhabdo-like virus 4]|uniref:RNA-directed RNA polymerase L n=1 Tax=Hubei rhabdo-like virus 4 TaxID=1923188 RepID=A0A1L3KMM2_9MONO|nr:RNA-dependent RNA polymerase [Hubei rhabdo-like virus 4]APG78632.1 RNA-dependent RNA polymerase [Hubei rhabdo-like virus 4]
MPAPSFINTFLDSPILIGGRARDFSAYSCWLESPKIKVPRRSLGKFRQWASKTKDYELDILDPGMYPALYDILPDCGIRYTIKDATDLSDWLSTEMSKALGVYGMVGVDMGNPIDLASFPEWGLKALKILPFFKGYVDALSTAKGSGRSSTVSHRESNWELLGDEFTSLLVYHKGKIAYMCSYEQILMWKDMLWGRFNVAVACQVLYPGSILITDVGRCLDWCFRCLEVYGNSGYELLKNIESLAKTNLVYLNDPVFGSGGSHDLMIEVVREKEISLGGEKTPLTWELVDILSSSRPLKESVELFGLLKLSGHPCVDPSNGGRKVRKIACKQKIYSAADCSRVRNNFCRMYVEGYVRKKSRWPPLDFPKHRRGTRLYQLYTLQETRINQGSYPLDDWEEVRFRKHHDFEYYPNFTDLMDDKAISYYRDQISYTWRRGKIPRSNKRLLIEMLSIPEISVRSIIDRVRTGSLPFEWFVVSLYPKEREFKLEPRMFAMMVFEMRVFFTATEANIADNIFPYLPPQTMTLSKQEIVERFHEVTWDPDNVDLARLYGEFDIESWNNNFQAPLVDPIARDMGDMHGEDNIFQVIHHFFTKCAVLVRVADNEPEYIEAAQSPDFDLSSHSSDLLWTDHLAGVEGIAQKEWTAVTYAIIDLAMQKFPISYHLIGQADNQIFVALLDCTGQEDRNSYIKTTARAIVEEVDQECRRVGHSTKKEECILSTTTVTYSKDVYIRGVEYYTSLKALSRIFPHSASDFPSINNSVGAISSQCIAASEKMKNPLAAYRIWSFHCAWYLLSLRAEDVLEVLHLGKESRMALVPDLVKDLLITPSDLGGLTILPITALLYKGGGDPLSKSYASLALLSRTNRRARRLLSVLHEGRWFWKQPELASLLDDPYSLPLLRSKTPEMSVQREGLNAIRARVVNRDIGELCNERVDAYEKELTESLLAVRPFNPALLADIKSDSVVGVKRQVARMFITTRTVQSLLQQQSEVNTCFSILNTGAGYAGATMKKMMMLPPTEFMSTSIYNEVERLRSFWRLPDGAKIVGLTVYTPFDGTINFHLNATSSDGVKALRIGTIAGDMEHSRGPNRPYLGRPTIEKRSVHGYRIVASSSPERAVARLSRVATQPGVGRTMEHLIGNVCQTRANVDFSLLIAKLGRSYGGTLDHRYTSLMGQRGAGFIGGPAFPSLCLLSSDMANPISGGADDYPVMVQEWMVMALSCLYHSSRSLHSEKLCTIGMSHLNMELISDSTMEAPQLPKGGVVSLSTNTMVYADTILLQRLLSTGTTPLIGQMRADALLDSRSSFHLRHMIRTSLTRSRSAAAVADKGAGTIHLSLDLMELRGFGLRKVFDAAALEIARFAIESLYSRSKEEMRWSPIPLVMSLGEGIARALQTVCHHTLFQQDEFIVTYGLSSPLQYTIAGSSAVTRIRNYITDKSIISMVDPSSQLYSDQGFLFGDDKDGEALSEILSSITLAYHQSLLYGELSLEHVYSVLRRKLREELRGAEDEAGQIKRLEVIVGRILIWANAHNCVCLSRHMTSLSRGKSILKTEMPVREAIREARNYPPPPAWISPVLSETFPVFPDSSPIITPIPLPHSQAPLSQASWSNPVSRSDIDAFSFLRMRGRRYGKESSVGYSYTGITDLTQNTVVLQVGCGYGSGSAVMLLAGASMVVGIDLDSDLTGEAVLAGQLNPPAVAHVGKCSSFVRYPPGLPGGGNFFDSRVVKKCREIAGQSSFVVVDVPLITRDVIVSLLSSLSGFSQKVHCAIRVIHRVQAIADLYSSLVPSCESIRLRTVFSANGLGEAWIILSARRTLTLDPFKAAEVRDLPYIPVEPEALRCLGGGRRYLKQMVLSPIGLGTVGEADNYRMRIAHLLSASVGEQEHRYTFRQWTEVLYAFAVNEVLSADDPYKECTLIKENSEYLVQFGSAAIPILATRRLLHMLTRLAPRLLD